MTIPTSLPAKHRLRTVQRGSNSPKLYQDNIICHYARVILVKTKDSVDDNQLILKTDNLFLLKA